MSVAKLFLIKFDLQGSPLSIYRALFKHFSRRHQDPIGSQLGLIRRVNRCQWHSAHVARAKRAALF